MVLASLSEGDHTSSNVTSIKKDRERYIPPKIKQLGAELKEHHNTKETLEQLRSFYPRINSYQTAVNRLRSYLIATEERHPFYESSLKAIEDNLVAQYKESLGTEGDQPGNEDILACIKFLYEFRGVPLRRQLNVVHKLCLNQMSLPNPSFKEHIQQLPILPDYVRDVVLTNEEQSSAQELMSASQQERSSNVVVVPYPNVLVKQFINFLRDPEQPFENVCVALAFVTGRRTVEILSSGSLDPITGYPQFAHFSGQAKTGLQDIQTVTSDLPRVYTIPLLANAKLVAQKLKDIQNFVRAELGTDCAHERINQKFSHKLSRAVKSLVHPEMRFHDLRTLYALVTYEAFKPHTYGLNGWVSRVLGHKGVNMSTHYTRMQIGSVNHIANTMPDF